MFAQGSTSSPFRSSGQQGLFSTPQQPSAFGQSSSTTGYGGYSSTSSSTPNTFAGPQFGGGNHGAAYGGQFGGAGAGVGGGGAGGAGYGSPFGGAGGMQSSTSGATGTPGAKRSYLPGYLSGGVAAQVRSPPRSLARLLRLTQFSFCSKPSRLRLSRVRMSGCGTPPRDGRLSRDRQPLALAEEACLADEMSGSLRFARPLSQQTLKESSRSTPSKSPKFTPYTAPPRATAYRQEVEEDAPPVASLNEFESSDQPGLQVDSSMNG